ncbi:MAG: DUF927 domain-containing protein [Lachnospiraceae bacterium]|nr:DUF927 domain-containing protein [Lachnospiraceae bacterium]
MNDNANTKANEAAAKNDYEERVKEKEEVKEGLKAKDIIVDDTTYSTGASAVANVLNSLVAEIERKAEKEKSKPKYKFLESNKSNKDYISKLQEVYDILEDIQKNLDKYEYSVKIYEDLDCEDVDKQNRYYIRISKFNKIYSEINLIAYENSIKDFEFDEEGYIENIVCKIEGYSSEKTKIIARYIVEYISNLIYFKTFYYITYSKIGWEYHNGDRNSWIFKYDQLYSRLLFLKGEIKKDYEYGLNCSSNDINIDRKKDIETILEKYISSSNSNKTYELSNDQIKQIKEELTKFNDYRWVITTKDLISNHAYCALILGAGISGLIRQLLHYTKETNININICGKPASGKSTISHYLLGIFGNPEVLEGSFTDTDNSIEFNRVKRPVLPYVLDERMLKIETASENVKRQKVFMEIFREYEGKVKERLGKQYEEFSGERTYGPVISSSVDSMMDILYTFENNVGQYRRFIELYVEDRDKKLLFSDSEEAERIEKTAYDCYGYGIRIIVDYMLYILNEDINVDSDDSDDSDIDINDYIRNKTSLTQRFDKLNIEIKDKLKEKEKNEKVGDLTSSSKRFALIVLSYQILKESLEFYMDNFYDIGDSEKENNISILRALEIDKDNKNGDIKDLSDEIIDILIENLILKMSHLEFSRNMNDKALYEYIKTHNQFFKESKRVDLEKAQELIESKGSILGYYTRDNNNNYILYTLQDYQLDMFWYMDSIPEPHIIKEYIEYVEDLKQKNNGKYDREKNKQYAKEKYQAIPENAQSETKNNTKRQHIKGTTIYISKKTLIINKLQANEEDQDEPKQTKQDEKKVKDKQ